MSFSPPASAVLEALRAGFFGFNLHAYGLIIGLAILVGVLLVEIKAKKKGIKEKDFWNILTWIILGGIIGARVWHVVTDFHFYINNFWGVFQIGNGGLSIFGAILGGILVIYFSTKQSAWRNILDLAVFGLPFGQAVGRFANFVNQELYGLPTNLPWGIYISPEFRFLKYQNFEYYHPLFAYEAILLFIFALVIWKLENNNFYKIGSGKYFLIYLIYYSIIRFLLDFLRIDKAMFLNTGLGVNQLVLLFVLILSTIFGLRRKIYEIITQIYK